MPIIAKNSGQSFDLIPAGTYLARCYQMLEIGTVKENFQGKDKDQHKVRIGWELPLERKVFNEQNGEQCYVISKEYTLSMHEKSNLRKMLEAWRGQGFTEDQAKAFDITKLLGVACMINIIHKPSKDGTRQYSEIAGVIPVPKGTTVPPQENKTSVLSFDNFDMNLFEKLPDFIKEKIRTTPEYQTMVNPNHVQTRPEDMTEPIDDLPF